MQQGRLSDLSIFRPPPLLSIFKAHVFDSDVLQQVALGGVLDLAHFATILFDFSVDGLDVLSQVSLGQKPLAAFLAGDGLSVFQAGIVNLQVVLEPKVVVGSELAVGVFALNGSDLLVCSLHMFIHIALGNVAFATYVTLVLLFGFDLDVIAFDAQVILPVHQVEVSVYVFPAGAPVIT